jgi:hypothetical protein
VAKSQDLSLTHSRVGSEVFSCYVLERAHLSQGLLSQYSRRTGGADSLHVTGAYEESTGAVRVCANWVWTRDRNLTESTAPTQSSIKIPASQPPHTLLGHDHQMMRFATGCHSLLAPQTLEMISWGLAGRGALVRLPISPHTVLQLSMAC